MIHELFNFRSTTSQTRLVLSVCLILAFGFSAVAAGAAPEPCREALPLPLDRSIPGHASAKAASRYAVEVTSPGLLLIEARRSSFPASSPEVRFLGRSCREQAANLPVPAVDGRLVHLVEVPGVYFVEVATTGLGSVDFRIDAWWVRDGRIPGTRVKEGSGTSEPMDEWNELNAPTVLSEGTWREVPGHGVLEITGKASEEGSVRFHPWCPWGRRPELLATLTCARQLRMDETGSVEVRRLGSGRPELVGITLTRAGRLFVEHLADTEAVLLDARGRFLVDFAREAVWLEAGRYHVQVRMPPSVDAVRLELD